MFDRLKENWEEFKEGTPGNRFQEYYRERQKEHRSLWRRALIIGLGILIMAGGVILLAIPGPGMLVIFIGAGFAARESLFAARALDWIEVRARKLMDWGLMVWRRASLVLKIVLVTVGAAAAGAAAFVAYLVFFPR